MALAIGSSLCLALLQPGPARERPEELVGPPGYSSASTAVLTMACGYEKRHLHFFVRSLRATGYSGAVVMAVGARLDPVTFQFLTDNNVTMDRVACSKVRDKPRWWANAPGFKQDRGPKAAVKMWAGDLNQIRYAQYKRWIEEGNYALVWLLDARDVVFQRDPFVTMQSNAPLSLFVDHPGHLKWDRERYRDCFSPKIMGRMVSSHAPTLCAGTISGTGKAVVELCRMMMSHHEDMLRLNQSKCLHNDQPIMNVVLFLQGVTRVGRHQHPVLGSVVTHDFLSGGAVSIPPSFRRKQCERLVGPSQRLVGKDGRPVAVVHKWPQCPSTRRLAHGLSNQSSLGIRARPQAAEYGSGQTAPLS